MRKTVCGLLVALAGVACAAPVAKAQDTNPGAGAQSPSVTDNWQSPSGKLDAPTPASVRGQSAQQPGTAQSYAPQSWPPFGPQPVGIQYGNLTIYPAVTLGAFHDNNIFATANNRKSDWAGFVRPELGLRWTGQNYVFGVQGFVERREYDRYDSENQTNGSVAAGGTYMPDRDTQIIGRFRYTHAHEERGSGESELSQFDRPLAYNTYEAAAAINRRYGNWWTSIGGANLWIDTDTPTILGTAVPQTYRDGEIGVVNGRLGFVVAPLTSIFTEVAFNRRNFDVDVFDSDGYRVVGGMLLEEGPGARMKGEIYAGYMRQEYEGISFLDVSTWTAGGALGFILTPQLTATVMGRREAKESALNGGVSVVESLVGGRLDYAILPNVVIGGGVTYLEDEFLLANRTDRSWSPLASIKYFVSPNVTLGVDYRRVNYDSSGFGVLGYDRDVVLFSLHGKL